MAIGRQPQYYLQKHVASHFKFYHEKDKKSNQYLGENNSQSNDKYHCKLISYEWRKYVHPWKELYVPIWITKIYTVNDFRKRLLLFMLFMYSCKIKRLDETKETQQWLFINIQNGDLFCLTHAHGCHVTHREPKTRPITTMYWSKRPHI